MANTYKMETVRVGADLWDIHYRLMGFGSDAMIRIETDLLRKDKKWYQSKYIYCNYTYTDKVNMVEAFAKDMINEYYNYQANQEKIIEFFNK